jgi:hypothetical protein
VFEEIRQRFNSSSSSLSNFRMSANNDSDAVMMTYKNTDDEPDEQSDSRKKTKRTSLGEVAEAKAEEAKDAINRPADESSKRGRPVQGFAAAAPARKKLDDAWTLPEQMEWAAHIDDPLPARKREDSSDAVISGTSVHVLGICRSLIGVGLENVAETVRPDTPGNYLVSGLTPDTWVKLDEAVATLRPLRNSEAAAKAIAPRSWDEYDDLSALIFPNQLYTPSDVALGFPRKGGVIRPIRIFAIKGTAGKNRIAVKAVFDSLDSRSKFLQHKYIPMFQASALVTKDLNRPDPAPSAAGDQQHRNTRNPPPGRRARRGGHE